MNPTDLIDQSYRILESDYGERLKRLKSQAEALSLLRLVFAGIIILIFAFQNVLDRASSNWYIPSAIALFFLVTLFVHRRKKSKIDECEQTITFCREAVARRARNWDRLPGYRQRVQAGDDAWLTALNIVGQHSLLHLLDTLRSPRALKLLLSWLASMSPIPAIVDRQVAVQELAKDLDFRMSIYLYTKQKERVYGLDDAAFSRWAKEGGRGHAPPIILVRILTASLFVIFVLALAQIISLSALLAPILFSVAFNTRYLNTIHNELNRLERSAHVIGYLHGLCGKIVHRNYTSARLANLRDLLRAEGGVRSKLRTIQRLVYAAEIRHAGMIYFFLQVTTLWSFHVDHALRGWRTRHGARVEELLNALAELEAIATLAGLAYDHPTWTYPEFDAKARQVSAEMLGHPLLSPATRIDNDIRFGARGEEWMLLTGSNMSGKSTLLRTVGINLLLAGTGAPVCAAHLTLPRVMLMLCFGSQDDLNQGVSLFMAEIQCLTGLRDAMIAMKDADTVPVFLLDEILRGTNSRDRHAGAVRVIESLLAHHGIGVVATHDLGLVDEPTLQAHALLRYLEDQLDDQGRLTFDYRLKEGVCTSSNALALLDRAGFVAR